MTGTDETIEVPWQWSWVPAPDGDPAAQDEWLTSTAALFDGWVTEDRPPTTTAEHTDSERVGPDGAGVDGAGVDGAGSFLAQELCRHAGDLPVGARLLWGVGFDAHGPRWWPVQIVVDRVGDAAEDPDYLLEMVGAKELVDGVAPNVTYVSTNYGDGLRVIRAERAPDDRVNALIRAAIRIGWPATADSPAMRSDLLLTTRVWDMSLLAVIGPGVDRLMRQMADAGAPAPAPGSPTDRPTDLVECR